MNWLQMIIISIVEGVTEFLPISSTGHMIIAQSILGVAPSEFVKAFIVNIQFGAILSVVFLYWREFFKSFDFYFKLFVAFLPSAILGFLFIDVIDQMLENVTVVAISLLVGGILLLFVDKWFNQEAADQQVTYKKAGIIGFFQALAMIPGVSRSAATIVGGMAQKLSRKKAAEFSFFLAVPTMFVASAYKLLKNYHVIQGGQHMAMLVVGNIVAFGVALLAIKGFIALLTKYGFKTFGYYRIVLGLVLLILLFSGVSLRIL